MRPEKLKSGFSAIELMVTLFIASMFLFAGIQLYQVASKDGNGASLAAIAATTVDDYLTRYKGAATNPCTVQTPLNNSAITVTGLTNTYISVFITCPYSSNTTLSQISATLTYGTPSQTITDGTLIFKG